MNEFSQSVMIALLPTTQEWCHIELPHMTLVYVGEIPDLRVSTLPEISKDVYDLAKNFPSQTLTVLGVEIFGKGDDEVDVFRLFPTRELLQMRQEVERWNGSEYRQYAPHATIGPVGTADRLESIPETLTFDRIVLSWGNENLMYMLQPEI